MAGGQRGGGMQSRRRSLRSRHGEHSDAFQSQSDDVTTGLPCHKPFSGIFAQRGVSFYFFSAVYTFSKLFSDDLKNYHFSDTASTSLKCLRHGQHMIEVFAAGPAHD